MPVNTRRAVLAVDAGAGSSGYSLNDSLPNKSPAESLVQILTSAKFKFLKSHVSVCH